METQEVITILKVQYRIPFDSVIKAQRALVERGVTDDEALDVLGKFLDREINIGLVHVPTYTFRWFVSNLIQDTLDDFPRPLEEVYQRSLNRAKKYVRENPWIFDKKVEASEEQAVTQHKDDNGNVVVKRKGEKMHLAKKLYEQHKEKSRKDIIALFVKEIPGMLETTASTYHANFKSGRW